MLNVALGGDLIQHLPDRVGTDVHCPTPGVHGRHPVRLAAGSRLARGARDRGCTVATYHHQAVDLLGDGLVATGWADGRHGRGGRVHRRGAGWSGCSGIPEVLDGQRAVRALSCGCRGSRDAAGCRASGDPMTGGNVETLWARSVFSPVPVRNAFEVTVERLAQGIRLGRAGRRATGCPGAGIGRDVRGKPGHPAGGDQGAARCRPGRVPARPWRRHLRGRAEGGRARSASQIGESIAHSLDDALDLRRVVEPGAAALAASRTLTADDRASLLRYLDEATHCAPPSGGWPIRGCTWRSRPPAAARR